MSHAHSDEDKANSAVARELWEKLKGIKSLGIEDAMIHFLRIIHMAELLALSNREGGKKKAGVFDVLSCGVCDSATVMGVSSTLRQHLAAAAVSSGQVPQNDVGAFDGAMSRLTAEMEAVDASNPPKGRPFDCCAEHVVYEKLGRLGYNASSTYAVQMVKPKTSQGFSIKVVERCKNCKVAGGASSSPSRGQPFGSTPRLGAVVTDSPALVNLRVPVLTPLVLQIIRDTLRGSEFNDRSRAIVTQHFPVLRVFQSPSWQSEHRPLDILGS